MTKHELHLGTINKVFFFILLFGLTYLAYKITLPYLGIIGLGLIVVILFSPLYHFFLRTFKYNSAIATGLSVAVVFLCVLIPLLFVGTIVIQQTQTFYSALTSEGNVTLQQVADRTNDVLAQVPGIDFRVNANEIRQSVSDSLSNIKLANVSGFAVILTNATSIGAFFVRGIINIVIFIFVLVTLFPTHTKLLKYFRKLSPMEDKIDELYIKRVIAISKAMVLGTLIIAIVQGILSGIGLAIAGVPYVLFWTMVITFFSLLPIGATWINIPIAIVLLLLGQTWQGLFLVGYHFVLVNNIDNVLRVKLVPREAALPGLLTLVSILGGIQVFNYWGFIYGPVIMILFVTTLEVYLKYYHEKKDS